MIESIYWKKDLDKYKKKFKPLKKPPRWSEKLQVNFEKDVIIAFFMIRKLIESNKVSLSTRRYQVKIFQCPNTKRADNLNFRNIGELYDLDNQSLVQKEVYFLCNQFIHGGATYAYRNKDRNWGGIYTCSDYERNKYIYNIPVEQIVKVLELVINDYPTEMYIEYSSDKNNYIIRL